MSRDPAVIPHHPNQFLGGQGGRGGSGGMQGQGGAGGTGEGPRVHITAHNVTNMHPSPAVVQASQVLNHCPPPSKNFQGRQAILNEMHWFFAENTGVEHIYVLYGLGGAGKTQIALKAIADSTRYMQAAQKELRQVSKILPLQRHLGNPGRMD
ncbi:hypothetical protein K438DRAFT_1842747 [Mycena galopus ATCC 62051]|nr:hypothetical protein K438DRAFT_1842747 [Mycena galopus ATCC 62051]